ncbi:hypothetical protein B296_00032551 [Ensete ventricosum]|uniref:Uncharacterized protein n=1 Tax=Ensete ventricosum TaxID=4639 RepID=A0A427ADD4_ENSVE|nr:hypothetical protein B296_00032551 [Ensete ventricosum]
MGEGEFPSFDYLLPKQGAELRGSRVVLPIVWQGLVMPRLEERSLQGKCKACLRPLRKGRGVFLCFGKSTKKSGWLRCDVRPFF